VAVYLDEAERRERPAPSIPEFRPITTPIVAAMMSLARIEFLRAARKQDAYAKEI
jgi:hypothetical protein